ncbi:MAG TPA: hypothetical protein PKA64_23210, partial [Myxococcota bacterium]|nr:hypothetical protein [Myxococcota bacterium]
YGATGALCTDLERPRVLTSVRANAAGAATISLNIPSTIASGTSAWLQVVTWDGSASSRSNVVSDTIETVVATISPASPTTDDDLTLTLTGSLLEQVSSWRWKRNGTIVSGLTSSTLPAAATTAGQRWKGEALVLADGGQQVLASSDDVTIAGTAPQVDAVSLVAATSDAPCAVLTCAAAASDVDGDAVTLSWRWKVDGAWIAATGSTLTGWSLVEGDEVACEATATTSDGSASAESNTLVVDASTADEDGDGACVAAAGCLASTDLLSVTRVGDTLTCRAATWRDGCDDGADLTVTWTVDGVVQAETSDTLDTTGLAGGAVVSCALSGTLASGYPANDADSERGTTLAPSTWTLYGEATTDQAGRSVAVLDDLDGDGFAELGVGAPNAAPAGMTSAGRVYVVYGRDDGLDVDLADVALGEGGWAWDGQSGAWDAYETICSAATSIASQIRCIAEPAGRTLDGAFEAPIGDGFGTRVRSADVDGDGVEDVIVAAPYAATSQYLAGRTYVISGALAPGAAITDVVGETAGFVVDGAKGVFPVDYATGVLNDTYWQYDGELTGMGLATGDFDGDGLADLFIGAPNVDTLGRNSGLVYVVYGSVAPASVSLASADEGVSTVAGAGSTLFWTQYGASAAVLDDVDGDGDDELLLQPQVA